MKQSTRHAAEVLKNSGIIIYSTETIPGIGCLSSNTSAIKKIFTIKERDPKKAMLVLANNIVMIKKFKENLSKLEQDLLLSVEPTTVILNNVKGIPKELTGENSSLAVRITKHETCLELIKLINEPLVSTSINISGETAATNYKEIPSDIKSQIDYILLDKSENNLKKASRIVKVEGNKIIYIRK
jgi:L-threonylcarbamoyladenylate synthase